MKTNHVLRFFSTSTEQYANKEDQKVKLAQDSKD